MDYWPHQIQGLADARSAEKAGVNAILLTSPTGGGKSLMMEDLISEGLPSVLYTHRTMLRQQLEAGLGRAGLQFGVRAAGTQPNLHFPIQISSIQTEVSRVYRRKQWSLHQAKRVFIDEAHVQGSGYSEKIIQDHISNGATVFGFTATPLGLDHIYKSLVIAGRNSELRKCGAHVPCYTCAPDEPDLGKIGMVNIGEDLTDKDNHNAIMRPGILGRVHSHWKRLNPEARPTILFGPDVAGALWFAQNFYHKEGVPAGHIDSDIIWMNGEQMQNNPDNRARLMEASRTGEIKVLTNRFVLREGIDLPWLYHGIFATTFGSLTSYLQAGGRLLRSHPSLDHVILQDHGGCLDTATEILTRRGWSGIDDMRESDSIGTMNIDSGKFEWCDNLGTIRKPVDAKMLSVDCPHADICVTDYHNMIMKPDLRGKVWKKVSAKDLSARGSNWILPTSAIEDVRPCDLTDHEIGFIGWYFTDGGLDSARIRITQSLNNYQSHHDHIKQCIEGCGFRYRIHKRVSKAGTGFSRVDSGCLVYSVSSGRKSPGGWDRLTPWIDKSFPLEHFDKLDRRQFGVLLHAMNLGDGCKHKTYNQRTFSIAVGPRDAADRIQSLAVRRGYRCNLKAQWQKCNSATRKPSLIHILHIRDASQATIGKCQLSDCAAPCDRVWCVQTKNGTIVTRRNGKVAILGNSWWRHGSLNDDRDWQLDYTDKMVAEMRANKIAERGDPEPIICPKCCRPRMSGAKCPYGDCGYEATRRTRMVVQIDGTLREVEGKIYKPKKIRLTPSTEKDWVSTYFRAKKSKNEMTFNQAYALYYLEHGHYPPKTMPFMPTRETDWYRSVKNIPMSELTRSEK